MEQVDEGSMDDVTPSSYYDYDKSLYAKDEEDLSMATETEVSLQLDYFHQDSLVPCSCSIETSSLEKHNKALELVMRLISSSNGCLFTIVDVCIT